MLYLCFSYPFGGPGALRNHPVVDKKRENAENNADTYEGSSYPVNTYTASFHSNNLIISSHHHQRVKDGQQKGEGKHAREYQGNERKIILEQRSQRRVRLKDLVKLLKEAGVPEGFKFKFHNRGVEQPYKVLGIWLIDQWRKIGLEVEHWVQPTAQFYATLRANKQAYQVSMDFNCRGVVNPLLDITKFLSNDIVGNQYAEYQDRVLDELHAKIMREIDPVKLKKLIFQFEKRALDEEAHQLITLWWNRIVPHYSHLKGWKISPSHYLNQDLVNVWLAK